MTVMGCAPPLEPLYSSIVRPVLDGLPGGIKWDSSLWFRPDVTASGNFINLSIAILIIANYLYRT